jgi:cytochrome c1
MVYGLGAAKPIINGTEGQTTPPARSATSGTTGSSAGGGGTFPYTAAQVASGTKVYAAQCASCHGAQLQGVSAPALTGSSIATQSVSQLRTTVTQSMPLTAPGLLKPDEYAAVMSYILAYDCVKPAGGGQTPFPTTDTPEMAKVAIGPGTCPQAAAAAPATSTPR